MIHEKKNGNVKLYICLAAALCAYLPTGVNMYAARAEKPSASSRKGRPTESILTLMENSPSL